MLVYYDTKNPMLEFAMSRLRPALEGAGGVFETERLALAPAVAAAPAMIVSLVSDGFAKPRGELRGDGYSLQRAGDTWHCIGFDSRGLMYAVLDVAEQLQMGGFGSLVEKVENPLVAMRGIRYCVPWSVYDNGQAFVENWEASWDIQFWKDYFDFLALHRYNCVTLWSRHPFHYMFRLTKYPDTTPLSEGQLEKNARFFRELFRHAKERGVDTYLITWNVDIIPEAVAGLGLPSNVADYNNSHYLRQEPAIIRDYFRECVKTLLRMYPDLTGLGVAPAEEMVDTPQAKEQWMLDTYMEAIKDVGRYLPIIHRTQQTTVKPIKDMWVDPYPGQTFISWKYSIGHMYSHPKPVFDQLGDIWRGVNMDEIRVTYTVRNDDFFTLRWGDPEFMRDYMINLAKPYVQGFYWGASGYMWGVDFQHRDDDRELPKYPTLVRADKEKARRALVEKGGHKTWTYDWEKHEYEFALIGRMAYNPHQSDAFWRDLIYRKFPKEVRQILFDGFQAGSKVIPPVNRFHWRDNHFEWFPECCHNRFGFVTVDQFAHAKPMPGVGTVGVVEFADAVAAGKTPEGETPLQIVESLREAATKALAKHAEALAALRTEQVTGELKCQLLDMEAWGYLGHYYEHKIAAAVALALLERTADESQRKKAVSNLEQAAEWWRKLALVTARHYQPYFHAGTKHMSSWALFLDEVEADVTIAQNYHKGKTGPA